MAFVSRFTFAIWTFLFFTLNCCASVISLDNTNFTVKLCCQQDKRVSENSCKGGFTTSWNNLQLYRIPEGSIKDIPDPGKVKNKATFQNFLNCKNLEDEMLRLSIPIWTNISEDIPKGFFSFFTSDGHFQYSEYAFSPEEYCIENITPDTVNVVACDYTTYCSTNWTDGNDETSKLCLNRCCDYGEVWDISGPRPRCRDSGENKWKLHKYLSLDAQNITEEAEGDNNAPVILSIHPRQLIRTCISKANYTFNILNQKVKRIGFGNKPFRVLTDGSVWMKLRRLEWVQLNPGEYCVDGFQLGEKTFTGDIADSILFECKPLETTEEAKGMERQRKYSLSFGIIISFCLLFLLITIAVYILLWSKHNIHGWTVFSYLMALLVTYFLLGASHFASATMSREQKQGKMKLSTFCGILGVLCHFSFLCTFSWSTVLSFDLFCTFRNLRPMRSAKSKGLKKFLFYGLFALTVPISIVAIGLTLDIIYSEDRYSDVLTAGYGKYVCYVEPRYARFYYVILPMAFLLSINFILFCNTAYAVYTAKKSTQFASSSSTKKDSDIPTFRLILKILLVNGAVWFAEILSWIFQEEYDRIGVVSFALDVINVLQAVAIFFIFVFKNDILDSLRKKYPSLEGTINFILRIKNLGAVQQSNNPATTCSTSYNVKTNENTRVSSL